MQTPQLPESSASNYSPDLKSRWVGLIALLFLLMPFSQLRSLPAHGPIQVVATGYGPEDMVIDSVHSPARLLVSCSSRRPGYPGYGEIEAIDTGNNLRSIMKRTGEPQGLVFRPHGISLVQAGEIQYLYVITHDESRNIHPIIQYLVDGENLVFVQVLNCRLLVSPNALQAFPDGSLLVCNDAANRHDMKEKIYRQKRGNVIFYDGLGNWSVVAGKLGMPAGLTGMGNRIFVSAALENMLYSFDFKDGTLTNKKPFCRIKGPDNIRICQNRLIVTSHSKPFKFILHTKNPARKSPSLVLSVDPAGGKPTRLFYDSGKFISAASVAVVIHNRLIIGQIFEPFIVLADPER